MKRLVFLFATLFVFQAVTAQSLYFPPTTGTTWDTISPSSLGWCPDKIDSLYSYLDGQNSKAFVLLKDGKIVLEKYFGTFTADSLWYWASAGKTLTAFTVGIAQQEGHLQLTDTTSAYLGLGWTDCPVAKEEKITVWNQLSMTSGLDDGVPDHFCTIDTCLQYLADAGTRWAYHNGPYTLLDGVIEQSTGQNLNAYFAAKVRNQIGMNGLFVPVGYNNVYFSNTRSFARFGLLMLNKGTWGSNVIMTDTSYFNQMVSTSQSLNESYGYLTWLNGKSSFMLPGLQFTFPGPISPNAPSDMYAAMGKNGQFVNVVPSTDMVVIRIGNAPNGNEVPVLMNDTMWIKINELPCGVSAVSSSSKGVDFSVSPNPSRGIMKLQNLENRWVERVILMNTQGKAVFSENIEADDEVIDLNFQELAKGVYLLRIESPEGMVVQKVLIW